VIPSGYCSRDFHLHRRLAVAEVHDRHKLKVLLSFLVSPGIEEELQELGVSPISQFRRIEGQIDVDAPDMLLRGCRKQEARHPSTDDHDGGRAR
jgi:hypothetical protein